jgi:serine/threonine protein kinase
VQLEGRVLGGTYRVERRLDEGGMGMVFEAVHLRLHRRVAVKVLSQELASSPEGLARFEQEAELMSQIAHPHVVTVLDFDVSDRGEPYLVLELLEGETLADRLDRSAPLSLEEAVAITVQTASGLAAAHRASIVHRDLKPPNVFLIGDASQPLFVKLLDFGIGKRLRGNRHITLAHQVVGTPEYMAPEQATGRVDLVSARTDQYSLAVVLYEMLTGLQPFAHDDVGEILRRVTTLVPMPASSMAPWVPEALDAVLSRALAKSPSDRFDSITAFAAAVAAATGLEPVADGMPGRGASSRPSPARPSSATPPAPRHASNRPEQPREGRESARPPSSGARGSLEQWIDRTRRALTASEPGEAASHAEVAFDIGTTTADETSLVLLRAAEPVLTQAFLRRLGSARHRLYPRRTRSASDFPLSPRAAFLLSRIDEDMSVEEAIDVSAMPRLETLRTLVQLVRCGALRTGGVTPH